jgi:hypothetical protein
MLFIRISLKSLYLFKVVRFTLLCSVLELFVRVSNVQPDAEFVIQMSTRYD